MENSSFLSLNWKDMVKSAYMLALTMLVTFVSGFVYNQALPTGAEFIVELKIVGFAVAAYVLKQLVSGLTGIPFKKE